MIQPHMPEAARARLETCMREAASYLEFGSGGSTVLAARLGIPDIVSVDSSPQWLADVAADVDALGYRGRLQLLHADVGPVKEWGVPVDHRRIFDWPGYYAAPWAAAQARGLAPDLVLVDGRFRVACFLLSLLSARPGATILFDDYRDRPEYHGVEALLAPHRLHDRMAEFAVPPGIDTGAVARALLDTRYVLD